MRRTIILAAGRRSSSHRTRRGITASEAKCEEDTSSREGGTLGWTYENPDVKLSLLWRAMQRSRDLHGLLVHDISATLGALGMDEGTWINSGRQSLELARHLHRNGSSLYESSSSLGDQLMQYGDATMPHRVTLSFQRWAWSVSRMHATLMRGHKPFTETSRTLDWLSAHVYPTHNAERLLIDPMVEATTMIPSASNPTGEQSPSPWMWVRDYDVEVELGVSYNNALKGRRLTKEQSLDFIKDLPYRRGALDDGGVSSLGRLTGKSSHRGVAKVEKTKASKRTEGCPLADDGSPTLDVAPLPLMEHVVSTPAGAVLLSDALETLKGQGSEGVLTSYLCSANFDLLTACCEGHARILSALYIEGRPIVVMSNSAAVVRYLETIFGEYVEKGAVEIVALPTDAVQVDEVLGAVLRDDGSFVPRGGEGCEITPGEATQYYTRRHGGTWLLTDGAAQVRQWGEGEVRSVVQYALQNGADTLCVAEYIGTDNIAKIRGAIPSCEGARGKLSLLVVPSTADGGGLHKFVASSVTTSNMTIIGSCGSVGSRTVESMSRGRTAREIALSPKLNPTVHTIGINMAATDALLYFPAVPYTRGLIGNTARYVKATRSIIQHALCPNSVASSEGPWSSFIGAGMLRRGMHKAMWATDYSSGGIFTRSDPTVRSEGGGGFVPAVGPCMSQARTGASQREIDFLAAARDSMNGRGGLSLLVAKLLGV